MALQFKQNRHIPEAPNGETQVDITFRIKDNISGYRSTDMLLRDPQGVTHFFRHYDEEFHDVYFSRDPTVYESIIRQLSYLLGVHPVRGDLLR